MLPRTRNFIDNMNGLSICGRGDAGTRDKASCAIVSLFVQENTYPAKFQTTKRRREKKERAEKGQNMRDTFTDS